MRWASPYCKVNPYNIVRIFRRSWPLYLTEFLQISGSFLLLKQGIWATPPLSRTNASTICPCPFLVRGTSVRQQSLCRSKDKTLSWRICRDRSRRVSPLLVTPCFNKSQQTIRIRKPIANNIEGHPMPFNVYLSVLKIYEGALVAKIRSQPFSVAMLCSFFVM